MPGDRSSPFPLGVRPRDGGVDVAVVAAHADLVELCVFEDGVERRVPLTGRTHDVHHGFADGVPPGSRYGLRVHGPWLPRAGHRHNPAKLLLDPYARAVVLPRGIHPALYGHTVGDDLTGDPDRPDPRDSAPHAAYGVVVDAAPGGTGPRPPRPRVPMRDTVLYEAHPRGLTRTMPAVPEELRGRFGGLAHPAVIEHLLRLGVTSVELLPVHAFLSEPALTRRGLRNYWGYNTVGFFAPQPSYAGRLDSSDPAQAPLRFREMVDRLHEAGLEVLLDVVYNHTCEGGADGPMLSFRGLDSSTYYRLDGAGRDVDSTGCGNSLDASNVHVVRLVMDSLRYWVQVMGVDGFRFDLAPTLARDRSGDYDPDHPLLVAMRTDPVLADVKLIAEPWDVGPFGWRTGQFPAPFGEWNDRYRDDVRSFWLQDARRAGRGEPHGGVRAVAMRLAGSSDTFAPLRGPAASVNFVTAHDGYTLADTTAYEAKHNLANGEGNRDGAGDNRSWNHGVEGPTTDPAVVGHRLRSVRNMLGTLLLSGGVPMLVAGDEFGRTQHGNNNAYCQDNAISWVDWRLEAWQEDLLETARFLGRLRAEHPALRRDRFFTGVAAPDGAKDIAWYTEDGAELDQRRWEDPTQRVLQVLVRGEEGDGAGSLLVVVQGTTREQEVALAKAGWVREYRLLWDSSLDRPQAARDDAGPPPSPGAVVTPGPLSLRVYAAQSS